MANPSTTMPNFLPKPLDTDCAVCGSPLHHKQPESIIAHYLMHIAQSQAALASDLAEIRRLTVSNYRLGG